jgi:hypothetical protein
MGHDRRSYGTVLLADYQLDTRHADIESPTLDLDDIDFGTAVRLLHLVRRISGYARAHRKSMCTLLLFVAIRY